MTLGRYLLVAGVAMALGCGSTENGSLPSGEDASVAASDGAADAAPAEDGALAATDGATLDGGSDATVDADSDGPDAGADAGVVANDGASDGANGAIPDSAGDTEGGAQVACSTRVTYGSAWVAPANHPSSFDVVAGEITWDGTCTNDAAGSHALLSNGWEPHFQGNGACVIALDYQACVDAEALSCTTRVSYGSAWLPPANHPNAYDDIPGRVFSDGVCHASGANSEADLSNGWTPTFAGTASCDLSFEYSQCGGLYANPVIPTDCPDPGVLHDGDRYVLTCTSGDAADAFPIYTSPDLATWTLVGHVFPAGQRPAWAKQDFWAPEIHAVGSGYVVYFAARGADGMLAVGAASASSALGPFTDLGAPLIHDASMGLIDPSEINAPGGPYVLWKEDGNAIGKPTPINAQLLAADGLSLLGAPTILITNDQSWEGAVTEAPFMVEQGGMFYLFYSGNSYANSTYAVGVARATAPTGPFTKPAAPILVTGGAWVGPGHCAVVDTPAGDTAMVYAAWKSGCVNATGCGRLDLVDEIQWGANEWPAVPLAPSSNSRPLL